MQGKRVGGNKTAELPKICGCLRQRATEMKGNKETVAADSLWCSC